MPSAELYVTVKPPCTALSTVTVKTILVPSLTPAGLFMETTASSLSVIVPVAVPSPLIVTKPPVIPLKVTVNNSDASTISSSFIGTLNVLTVPLVEFAPNETVPEVNE